MVSFLEGAKASEAKKGPGEQRSRAFLHIWRPGDCSDSAGYAEQRRQAPVQQSHALFMPSIIKVMIGSLNGQIEEIWARLSLAAAAADRRVVDHHAAGAAGLHHAIHRFAAG